MPELPEVETVRRALAPVLEGRCLATALARRPDLRWPLPPRFAQRLSGRRVAAVRRRSKYLLLDLEAGDDGPETWMVHLGMSGRLLVHPPQARRTALGDYFHDQPAFEAHDHVCVALDDGTWVIFNDPRRFGAMDLWPTPELEAHPRIAGLGPEPLGNAFSGAALASAAATRRTTLKALLLDQRVVAGLGNIYVCEALHLAGLSPLRQAAALGGPEAERLAGAIRTTLTAAIEAGGSTLRDHARPDGAPGAFQHGFRVYARAGLPCPREGCGGRVARTVQSGRSSFHCPACQA